MRTEKRIKLLQECISATFSKEVLKKLRELATTLVETPGLIITAGNGGSQSMAEHLTAELVWRLDKGREIRLPSICLGSNASTTTAITNDSHHYYNFLNHFAPFCSKLRTDHKVPIYLIVFSTSGTSNNIQELLKFSRELEDPPVTSILLTGKKGRPRIAKATHTLYVDGPKKTKLPADVIQEIHLIYIHLLCDMLAEQVRVSK